MKNKTEHLIFGIHPLAEAISAGKEINKVLIRKGIKSELFSSLFQKIREYGIPYQYVPLEKLNRMTSGNHQGVVALLSVLQYQDLEEIIQRTFEEGRDPFIAVLDSVTDVRNFGAIARTAECAGIDSIVIPGKGSAVITPDALKTSAGALNRVAVCRQNDLEHTLKYIKASGIQIVAASEKASQSYYKAELTGPIAILIGSEGRGIKPSLERLANTSISIPLKGSISSLNVGVAFGILAFEVLRQRQMI